MQKKSDQMWFAIVLAAYSIYAAMFIYRTSFVVGGHRFFVLFDDAMISMRYAANLAAGYGLVWNPGDVPVEGFTNPLWVLFMALVHLLPIDHTVISVVIQATGAVLLGVSLVFIRKIAGLISNGSSSVMLGAVVATAFYYPIMYWSFIGMEVSALILIASGAVWIALKMLRDDSFSPWLYLILGIGTLVRIDAVIVYGAILLYFMIIQRDLLKRHLLWGVGVLAVFLIGQTMLRLWYYGEPLPNTYYLKMVGIPLWMRVGRGAIVFADFVYRQNLVLFLLPLVYVAIRPSRYTGLLVTVSLMQFSYSIYVGGDAWEEWSGTNRFISSVMPLYLVLIVQVLHSIVAGIIERVGERGMASPALLRSSRFQNAVFGTLIILSILQFNSYAIGEFLCFREPAQVSFNREMVERVAILRYMTEPDATVGVTWAGIMPYFAHRYTYDILGKNDLHIAHQNAHIPDDGFDLRELKPGHLKWDYDYTYGRLQPDVITHQWGGGRDVAIPYIQKNYVEVSLSLGDGRHHFMLRRGSDRIKWNLMPANVHE